MARVMATLDDVARVANVSKSTASRILGEMHGAKRLPFASETRQRVVDAAAKLGYQPSKIARGLSMSKTGIIGLVIPSLTDSYFPEVATAIETSLADHGYSVLLANTSADPKMERTKVDEFLSWRVDGLIVAPAQKGSDAGLFWDLWRRNVPFVLIDRAFANTPFGSVITDDEAGAAAAVEHLIAQDRKRIARIGESLDISTNRLRQAGYAAALIRHGVAPNPEYAFDAPASEEGGRTALARLFETTPRPDAVFCFSDVVAVGVLEACRDRGLRVPEDLAVVGYADLPHSGLLKIGLTTVRQPHRQLGRQAAAMLVDCMENGGEPTQITLPVELVVRESTVSRASTV